jgi:hypothetical protein
VLVCKPCQKLKGEQQSAINKEIIGNSVNIYTGGRAMAQAVSRRPLTSETRVRARDVGFVVDKVVLGQAFLRVLRFSPANIIPPSLYKLISKSFRLCWGSNFDRPTLY